MRKGSFLVPATIAVALVAYLAPTEPARAQDWPWCATHNHGGANCGFASWQQCQSSISGRGGFCSPNPHAQTGPAARRERRR
jgi:hypothetical protein